jgi:hypothetical protein
MEIPGGLERSTEFFAFMRGKEWRTAAMRAFPLLALLLACSFKPELAHPEPAIMVENLLNAKWSGERVIFDKSENLVQTAGVLWTCKNLDPHHASCEEELAYRDAGRPALPGKPALDSRKEYASAAWKFDYMDRGPVLIERTTGDLKQTGQVRGALLFLEGQGLIPRSNTTASVEMRFFAADATQNKLVQVEIYRRYGIELGRSITTWTRVEAR